MIAVLFTVATVLGLFGTVLLGIWLREDKKYPPNTVAAACVVAVLLMPITGVALVVSLTWMILPWLASGFVDLARRTRPTKPRLPRAEIRK